jgi:FtsP/CotA-like multicopper oxidase with cupredoxin domain
VRGERVAVTIINQTHEGAAVHWHGIELESYPDGVSGFSGEGKNILPTIAPGDSLTVRFTPPRAGTFMYHSHFNEFQQISSGLYGALIVREPGEAKNPNERVLVLSDGGPIVKLIDAAAFPRGMINGQLTPDTMDIPGDVPVRLRVISIRSDAAADVSLTDGEAPVQWRIVAKDGMPATALQSQPRAAKLSMGAGEIYDFEVVARRGANLTFTSALFDAPPKLFPPTKVTIRVK